mmetsp:Transcript_2547/g.5818  ORF Transcript_2547/g.5818 Transcript_2547/m.5818 type:complete len:185 (-) Transcript_2547:52-606(-)
MYGNGLCDSECNDYLCDFDGGDCFNTSTEVYVSAESTGSNVGSWENPYFSVADALAEGVTNKLTIWLLRGEHQLLAVSPSIWVPNADNPLEYRYVPRSIIVTNQRCEASPHPQCASERAEMTLKNIYFTLTVTLSLEFYDLVMVLPLIYPNDFHHAGRVIIDSTLTQDEFSEVRPHYFIGKVEV